MLSLFPRDVLDEILDLSESVSKGFPDYFLNSHNKSLTATLLQQGNRYHKLRQAFSLFVVDTLNWFLNMKPD